MRILPTTWKRRLAWGAVQVAIVGGMLWLWFDAGSDPAALRDRPAFGLWLAMAIGFAFLATFVPIVLRDVAVGQFQHWRDVYRRRVSAKSDAPPLDSPAAREPLERPRPRQLR